MLRISIATYYHTRYFNLHLHLATVPHLSISSLLSAYIYLQVLKRTTSLSNYHSSTTVRRHRAQRSSLLSTMIVLPLLLLASDIIAKAGASSGQSLGVPSVGTVNTIDGSSIENDSTGRTNIQLKDAERLPAADFPVTDASSALAAKYASANIITGNIIDNEKAKSTASDTSGGGGGWFGKILGKSSSSDAEKNVASTGEIRHEIPPPPPPPPLQRQQVNNPQQQNVGSTKQTPPHQKQQLPQNYNSYNSNYPPYNPPSSYIDPAAYQNLLYELDESTLREMTLTHQLHNVSAYVDTLTSESENLIMRIDVLTERLADTNANFNFVHNRNLELEKNCTQLTATVESLSEEIIGYESKIAGMDQDKVESEKILGELRSELRKVTDELEKLACLVEVSKGVYVYHYHHRKDSPPYLHCRLNDSR